MKKAIILSLALVVLTGVGAVNLVSAVPYIIIGFVCVVAVLVATDKIQPGHYPIYLFGMALALLWQTSMIGKYIMGVDAHTEYYVVQLVIANGWDLSWVNNNNTSFVLGAFIPGLAKVGIDPIWSFKAVCPFIFAFAPLALFYAYQRMIGGKRAFFACLFLIIMPMYSMEVVSIAKTMVAMALFAVLIFMLVSGIKRWQKAVVACVLIAGVMVSHYTVGMMMLVFFVMAFIVFAITQLPKVRELFGERRVGLKYFGIVVLATVLVLWGWYGNVAGGAMPRHVLKVGENILCITLATFNLDIGVDITPQVDSVPADIEKLRAKYIERTKPTKVAEPTDVTVPIDVAVPPEATSISYLHNQGQLIRAAIGLDFMDVGIEGKAFRVLQFITQFLLAIGFLFMFISRKKYQFTAEYQALVISGYMILLICVFVPFFTNTISTTRWYYVSLLFIAPMLVIGFEGIAYSIDRGIKWAKSRL